MTQWRFIALAFLAETCIIYASVLVKTLEISPIMVGFYRVFLALPFFLYLARQEISSIAKKDLFLILFAGVLFGLDLAFFNFALHHTSVANVNLFGSLVCFVLVPIGIFFFHEKVNPRFFIGALVAIIGIGFLLSGGQDSQTASIFGDFLAVMSMVCYACFLAVIHGLRKTYSASLLMFFASIGSSCTLLIIALLGGQVQIPRSYSDISTILLVVLLGQVVGQGFFSYIMGKIQTQVASLILLLSPIIAGILGFVCLGEKLGMLEIFGIGVILLGVYLAKDKD
ncbi:DMT family transporter [Helicobacter enhydrae]|nr:DMT family transporter [Helicobacter enhydrae]